MISILVNFETVLGPPQKTGQQGQGDGRGQQGQHGQGRGQQVIFLQ